MALIDRPENNNDDSKHIPGSKRYEYLPKNYSVLTMESKFRLLSLREEIINASNDKYVMYEICMDAIAMAMGQLQTFKEMMKQDGLLPQMPSLDELETMIKDKKGE